MSSPFKPGDLVKLKMSKQKMTVKAQATKPTSRGIIIIEDRYVCIWYDGEKEQKAVFHIDALEAFPPYYDSMHFANYE
jgi:uncharacterized protein YodC (DUF2158 family)